MHQLKSFILACGILFLHTVVAQAVTTDSIGQLGLPVLLIATDNGEEPTCDYAFAPEGAYGITTINNTKVRGRCMLIHQGDTLFDSGSYEKDVSGMTFKIRGNTSAYYSPKKSFKIKLEKKNDLMARGDSCYYDKNWVLLRTGDCLYTLLGNKVNELVGMPWTPAMMFVNVIVNDDYRGIYMLTEQVKRNADCRLNVDKQTGFILERDAYWWDEQVYFKTELYQKEFTFKYPDADDVTDEQITFISDYLNRFENSLENGTYGDYIDLQTWASWMIAHDILGTWDCAGSNMYLIKYDDTPGQRLQLATMWDFDSILNTPGDWSRFHTNPYFYFPYLFNNQNLSFNEAYTTRYHELAPTIFNDLTAFLDTFEHSSTAQALTASYPYEYARWKYDDGSLQDKLAELREWLVQREAWLNQAVTTIPTAVHQLRTDQQASTANVRAVNMLGQVVNRRSYRGLVILHGKKIVAP